MRWMVMIVIRASLMIVVMMMVLEQIDWKLTPPSGISAKTPSTHSGN